MQIVKDYRENKELRDSFNELAKKVFNLEFEEWYRNGFWNEKYIPFSVVIDGKVVANVSVNKCDMNYNGEVLKLIQLGTVMTAPDYRGNGYAGMLMNENITNDVTEKIPMETPEDWAGMVDIMKTKAQCGNMTLNGNEDLFMFYLSQFMKENVYYISSLDTHVIAEIDGDTLMIHAIFGEAAIDDVIASFGSRIRNVILFFTPVDITGYEEKVVEEEDTTFFVKGKAFETLGDYKFMFQAIAHA